MNDLLGIAVILAGSFLSAFSQILLKKSADKKYINKIAEYVNVRVITAYTLLSSTILFNMYALQFISFKLSNIVGNATYIFVIILSKLFLDESITRKDYLGILIIIIGISIFCI